MLCFALLACFEAFAQTPPERRAARTPAAGQDRPLRDDGRQRPPDGPPGGGVIPRIPPGIPLRPRPDDFGPLRPGEEQRILEFAQRHMPEGHRRMRALLNRDPEAFRSRITAHLPRLRRLMSIFAADPELGRAFVRHMDNLLAVRRAREQLRQGQGRNPPADVVERLVRQRIAENVSIERTALERLIDCGQKARDADVKRLQEWLVSDQADVTAEPPELRRAVEEYRKADDSQRPALRKRLDELAAKRIDRELSLMRARLRELNDHTEREIDRRVERALNLRERDDADEIMAAPASRPRP